MTRARRRITVPLCLALVIPVGLAASNSAEPADVLVFSGTGGERPDGTDRGNDVLTELASGSAEFTITVTEDPAVLTAQTLADYDVLLFNNPSGASGAAPFTADQRTQITAWVECGGGVVAVGQATNAWSDWSDWDELVGIVASSSSAANTPVTVTADSPMTASFGAKGTTVSIADSFTSSADGQGPQDLSTDVTELLTMPGGPVAWTSTFRGANRSFVTDLGDAATTWDLPAFRDHVTEGISHAGAVRPDAECVDAIGSGGGAGAVPLPVGATMVVLSPPASSNTNPVRYAPDTIVLTAGSTIELLNADTVAHTITDSSGRKLFDSGFVALGATGTVEGVESLAPGTYDFFCQLHPVMVGTITIV